MRKADRCSRLALVLAGCIALTSCGDSDHAPPPDDAREVGSGEVSSLADAEATALRTKAETIFPTQQAPAHAPPAPVSLAVCDTEPCILKRVMFVNRDWPAAWEGDYEGQQNAAYCRETGCDTAVAIDKLEACAWRAVVMVAHPDEVTELDADMADQACDGLTATQREAAQVKMHWLIDQIYGD